MPKCGAPSRLTGFPCSRNVAPGFSTCFLHGAAVPSHKIAAERALVAARLPAIAALASIIHDWGAESCATCGRPNYENAHPVIRAAQIILDRTGMGPRATIEVVRPEGSELDVDAMTDFERERLADLLGQLSALKASVKARLAATPGDEEPQGFTLPAGFLECAPGVILGDENP